MTKPSICEDCEGYGVFINPDGFISCCNHCQVFEDDDSAMAYVELLLQKARDLHLKQQAVQASTISGFIRFSDWLQSLGIHQTTGWRWQQYGWIEYVNIGGKNYITTAEAERFKTRASAGEFAHPKWGKSDTVNKLDTVT